MIPTPDNPDLFGPLPFPRWVTEFRANQWAAIEQIHDAFEDNDLVFLQAPTGTGKSLIGDVVRRLTKRQAAYCCTTKALQDQFTRDFPYSRVIKGRSNYLTESGTLDRFGNPSRDRWSSITCADCTYSAETESCRWCFNRGLCPYVVARDRAAAAELAVLNTSYLLTDLNKGKGNFARGLFVIDEADQLESEMLGHVEVEISERRQDLLGIQPPRTRTEDAKSNDWIPWCNHAIDQVKDYKGRMVKPWDDDADSDEIQEYKRMEDLHGRLKGLRAGLEEGGWVYDGYEEEYKGRTNRYREGSGNEGPIIFRPIFVHDFGQELLWKHGNKFLLMSATILSADMMADELGYTDRVSFIEVPSTFPVENRPIFVSPVANMSFKTKREEMPRMLAGVKGVLRRHPNDRVLVHTVSYDLARYLHDGLDSDPSVNRPLVTYTSSRDKQQALAAYSRKPNSVLLASSMDRGIDLPGDLCRVQIVAKIPFPNLGDKRVKARAWSQGGDAWYKMHSIRTLIQMCGRAVRSDTDWAKTYILDEQFLTNLWKSEYLFPEYWKDALNFRLNPDKLIEEN